MKRLVAFFLSSLLLISCSTKTENKVIPTDSIYNKDIINAQEPLNIALVVPIAPAGDNKGATLVQAAQIAVASSENENIHLSVFDSNLLNSNEASLISDLKNQQIIIGPLYGPDTEKLSAGIKSIPILSLSNDSSIKSNNTLIMGFSPTSQAITVMEYAISQGVNKFHLLVPENKFGHLINSAVEGVLAEKNGMSYTANWYEQNNSEDAIEQLVASLDHNAASEAIFMPQGDKKALNALNRALGNKKSKIKLIGLQGWDNAEVASLGNLDGAVFIRKNIPEGKFHDRYQSLFGGSPSNLEYITYNSIMLAINMHNEGISLTTHNIIEYNQSSGKYSDVKFNDRGYSFYDLPLTKINGHEFTNLQ